ncbi:hypothetical protein EJB05_51460 [Eragrostis curvula]|uniref:Cytochrome b5 heme-binding domain-containing protein n=1 Tax=Eragrostis curvula TaxID=38414 RepID=A0A5J9SVI5_9POAL|nr:hypothetical protein EJB05_51460 [Eragrostis curvula]
MAMAEWWEAAKAAVAPYTGMTPAAFLAVVAVSAALCVAVSKLLGRPAQVSRRSEEEERAFEPLPPPVQLGEVTEEELRAYDGSDPKKPLLMAIKGQIYDVTQSRIFYGPGGPYASFAGRDASRALAKMSFEPNDLTGDISGLGPFEVEALQEWEYKFKSKYVTVGKIKKTIQVCSDEDTERVVTREAVTSDGDIDASNMPTYVSEPTNQGNVVEKTWETIDVDVNARSNENVEKTTELPDMSSHADAVEKQEETPKVAGRNNSKTEDAVDS